jgi:hypothetical protein
VRILLLACAGILVPAFIDCRRRKGRMDRQHRRADLRHSETGRHEPQRQRRSNAAEQIATFKDGRVEGDRLIFQVGPYHSTCSCKAIASRAT